jgi:elongation factor G
VSGVFKLAGQASEKRGPAGPGDTVALGKLDHAKTSDTLTSAKQPHAAIATVPAYPPVLAFTVVSKERKDDVKLGQALSKLFDEDPSLTIIHNPETHEVIAWGQGEMHLRVATERLAQRFAVAVATRPPTVGYRETIRKGIEQRGRHKKQSGGHGQFGDVVLRIKPMPRGSGFSFDEEITGGVVPRNYIPSVEEGVIDALKHGPLGFPVVDLAVTLIDGSYHSVDSSDMAFRAAAKIAIGEALPKARPVLLEPILSVDIAVPSDAMSRATGLVSARRGQILGYDARPGWEGWDVLKAQIPEAEIGGLIVELRSATAGVGSYASRFDHLAEVNGKPADAIIAQHKHQRTE